VRSVNRSTVLTALVALVAGLVVAVFGEPSRTSEAAVERPIVATDAVCFGLVVTDVAVAAPVRRLDPPSLFPAGVGWDVGRGAVLDTAAGTFLFEGVEYASPSKAALKASGLDAVNGWTFWARKTASSQVTLAAARDSYIARRKAS
jgi:hypothetical protein